MADNQETKSSGTPPSQSQPATQTDAALNDTVEPEVNGDSKQNLDSAGDNIAGGNRAAGHDHDLNETRIPTKKDATLREFLSKMDEHAPIVCNFDIEPRTPLMS